MPIQNTIVLQWIIFGLSLAVTIGSVVAQFLGAGNYTPEAITAGVVALLTAILTQITRTEVNKAVKAGLMKK